jgi:hypothetical protein
MRYSQVAPRDLRLTPCGSDGGGARHAAPWATGRGSDDSDGDSDSKGGGESSGGGRERGRVCGWRVTAEDDTNGGASIRADDGLLVKEITVTFTQV